MLGLGNPYYRAAVRTPLVLIFPLTDSDHRMTFCQVVLDAKLINSVPGNPFNLGPWWDEKVQDHRESNPEDPIPIPFR